MISMNLLWIITLLFVIADAATYIMGGEGKPFKRWIRPVGVGITTLIMLCLWHWQSNHGFKMPVIWAILASSGASAGLSTSYFKLRKTDTVVWWNWLIAGIMVGIALLPYCWITHHMINWGIRSFVLGLLFCGWSQLIGQSEVEMGGRGAIITVTIPLIFVVPL